MPLKPYIDKSIYQEEEVINIMCLSPNQYNNLKRLVDIELSRKQNFVELLGRTAPEDELQKAQMQISQLSELFKILE